MALPMSTAQFFASRIKNNGEGGFHTVTVKESGVLLVGKLAGEIEDVYVNVLNDERFIIRMPFGNKIHSAFFSPGDRGHLLKFFFECAERGGSGVRS